VWQVEGVLLMQLEIVAVKAHEPAVVRVRIATLCLAYKVYDQKDTIIQTFVQIPISDGLKVSNGKLAFSLDDLFDHPIKIQKNFILVGAHESHRFANLDGFSPCFWNASEQFAKHYAIVEFTLGNLLGDNVSYSTTFKHYIEHGVSESLFHEHYL
jgi:hypothetical protein